MSFFQFIQSLFSSKVKVKTYCEKEEFLPFYEKISDLSFQVKAERVTVCESKDSPESYSSTNYSLLGPDELQSWTYSLKPGHSAMIECGFACKVPKGYRLYLYKNPWSIARDGVVVKPQPYLSQRDGKPVYSIYLFNSGKSPYIIRKRDTICRASLLKECQASFF